MNLDLINNIKNNTKENTAIQEFINKLTEILKKKNRTEYEGLKQENCLYQVVDKTLDGAFLYNTQSKKIYKETDIPKEVWEKIGNDFVLEYKNNEYVVNDNLTEKFFNSLVGINEYNKIKEKFIQDNDILIVETNTEYKIENRNDNYTTLSYGENQNNKMQVPNVLVPYWAKSGEILYYKNEKFNY